MKTSLGMVKKFFPQVTTVRDAKRSVKVNVKRQDNRFALAKRADRCAMARACKRELKLDGALVSTSIAYLVRGSRATRYHVPERISREIVSFDRAKIFAEGTYTLTAPETGQQLGSHAKKPDTRNRSGRAKAKHRATFGIREKLGK